MTVAKVTASITVPCPSTDAGTGKGTASEFGARAKILDMVQKGNRSKRRRPRKGFPHRVVGYLDGPTHDMVSRAAEHIGENISSFVARAVKDRAESILKPASRK